MNKQLMAVRAGKKTFAELVEATMGDWWRMADRMRKRYYVPPSTSTEDLVQEMLLETWRRMTGTARHSWDPSRGVTLQRYCIFNAHGVVRSLLKGGPNGRRYPFLVDADECSTETWLDRQWLKHNDPEQPLQDEWIERTAKQQEIAQLATEALAEDEAEREILPESLRRCYAALEQADGSIEIATCLLYSDSEARAICRLGNEVEAERTMIRAAAVLLGLI
jgi:hypothetical protein